MFKQVQTEQLQLSIPGKMKHACLAREHLRKANDTDVLVPPVRRNIILRVNPPCLKGRKGVKIGSDLKDG